MCKYWQNGYCSRGDECIYLHSNVDTTPEPKKKTESTIPDKKPPPPTTPSIKPSNNVPSNTPTKDAPMRKASKSAYLRVDMATKLKLVQLQQVFQHVEVRTSLIKYV